MVIGKEVESGRRRSLTHRSWSFGGFVWRDRVGGAVVAGVTANAGATALCQAHGVPDLFVARISKSRSFLAKEQASGIV